jgi:NAD(P)-dependent dehydrogenase (short-subunit alcohol dehydrogenase family)
MRALIFGSTGTLGKSIVNTFELNKWDTFGASRTSSTEKTFKLDSEFEQKINAIGRFDAVVFAQGKNANDSILDSSKLSDLIEANVTFIASSIGRLLKEQALTDKARITLIGSIWQGLSRSNKLSYTVSKSALNGLMNSMVADLSPHGISINTVAPGVVDSPMTRANLTNQQIDRVTSETPIGSLVSPQEVASLVFWISSPMASGVNGQTIKIDNGWSNVRSI